MNTIGEITEKKCRVCEKVKKLEEFFRCRTGRGGRHTYCKSCHKERYQKLKRVEVKEKRCKKCGRMKKTDQFQRSGMYKDGLQSFCKECDKEYNEKKRRKKNRRSRNRPGPKAKI